MVLANARDVEPGATRRRSRWENVSVADPCEVDALDLEAAAHRILLGSFSNNIDDVSPMMLQLQKIAGRDFCASPQVPLLQDSSYLWHAEGRCRQDLSESVDKAIVACPRSCAQSELQAINNDLHVRAHILHRTHLLHAVYKHADLRVRHMLSVIAHFCIWMVLTWLAAKMTARAGDVIPAAGIARRALWWVHD